MTPQPPYASRADALFGVNGLSPTIATRLTDHAPWGRRLWHWLRAALGLLGLLALCAQPARAQTCTVQTLYPSLDIYPCNGCGKFAWFIVPDGQTWELHGASASVLMPPWTNGMAYLLALDGDRTPLGTMELSAHPAPSGSVTQLEWARGALPAWTPPLIRGPLAVGVAAPLVLQSGQQVQIGMQPNAPWIVSAAAVQAKVCQ